MPPRSFERNDGGVPSLPLPPPRIDQQFGTGEPQQFPRVPTFTGSTPFGEKADFAYSVLSSPEAARGLSQIAAYLPAPSYAAPPHREGLDRATPFAWGLGLGLVGTGIVLVMKGKA